MRMAPGFGGRLGRLAFFGWSIAFAAFLTALTMALVFASLPRDWSRGAEMPAGPMLTVVAIVTPLFLYGTLMLQARRILSFSGTPTIFEELWLPGQPFKGLTAARMQEQHGPTYALFELEFGVRMVRASEKLRAVVATAEHSALLQVPSGTPLLSVERIAHTYHDAPMELRRGLYRTDTHHYRNELG